MTPWIVLIWDSVLLWIHWSDNIPVTNSLAPVLGLIMKILLTKKAILMEVSLTIAKLIGALAQLGERMTGSHEVRGSTPLCSTTL